MTERKKPPTGDYEVGYGKPPKETQFKSKKKRGRSAKDSKIDVSKLLSEPVPVNKNGVVTKMPAFEANLRAQVQEAIKRQSLPAILHVLGIAERYDLTKSAPERECTGGVLVVPGRTTREAWEGLFSDTGKPKQSKTKRTSRNE